MATVTTDSVAQDQLRAFIERIERMEEEKRAISDDIKEIYAEAKGNGFDTKVLRQIIRLRKIDHHERMEQEALLELYMSALGMNAAPRHHDEDDEYTPPPRSSALSASPAPSVSQIIEDHPQPDHLAGLPEAAASGQRIDDTSLRNPQTTEPAPSPSGDVAAASEGDVRAVATAVPAIHQPQPASLAGLPGASASGQRITEPDAPPSPQSNAPDSMEGGADAPALHATQSTGNVGGSAGRSHSGAKLPTESPASVPVDTPSTPDKSGASGLAPAPVVPFKSSGKPLRPYCQPDASGVCASPGGKQHCFRCEQLHRAGGTFPTIELQGRVN